MKLRADEPTSHAELRADEPTSLFQPRARSSSFGREAQTGSSARRLEAQHGSSARRLEAHHRSRIIEILEATNAFRDDEIGVALELFDASIVHHSPDYEFVGWFSQDSELIAYACYGASPGTLGTYDLYWIAVHPEHQGAGGGSRLLDEVERRLRERAARMLVVETSSRTDYESTRRFYERRGYAEHARLRDFYAFGDDRVIYGKRL
jgi:ribosomal protein S18 acetylase RimI-like enzyme